MMKAFPETSLTSLSTQSERDEQKGFQFLRRVHVSDQKPARP